jgi:hypothetical protein
MEVPHGFMWWLSKSGNAEISVMRQLTALFAAGAIVFGNIGASASTTATASASVPPSTVAKNAPPLTPGGPAGVRQAQGIEDVDVWVIAGLALGAIIWVLVDNDNDDSDSTNGTE